MTPESTGQQDLMSLLRIVWRWKLLLLSFLIVIPLVVYLLQSGKPKVYQSSTLVELNGAVGGANSVPVVEANPTAVAQVVTTSPVAKAAAAMLHPAANPAALLKEVSASGDTVTNFVTITARNHVPSRAAAVANAFAAALDDKQTYRARHAIDLQIAPLTRQLAAATATSVPSRASLLQQISTLRSERDSASQAAEVLQPAVASASPVGPKTRRDVEIAFLIALLLGAGAVWVAEKGDLRLRTPDALESLTDLPMLGVLPPSAFSPDAAESTQGREAFQILANSLMYFNIDRQLSSVAIVSPGPAEGKTTVATGIALAAARAGKRVILLDADLRRPQIASRLHVTSPAGLGGVLTGQLMVGDALLEQSLDVPSEGSLRVLPAGPPPPNPAALLVSQEMRRLIRQLEAASDLLVIDTPAALAVSDVLPVVQSVSGIVMIVRMNRSSRAAVRRTQKVITSADGTLLGVVATGSSAAAGGYGKRYGYYAYASGSSSRFTFRRRSRASRSSEQVNGAPTGSVNGSSATSGAGTAVGSLPGSSHQT